MDPEKFYQSSEISTEERGHHLKFGDLLRLSVRVFRARPLRTFLTILGVSVGIGTVLFLVSLGYGLQYILIGKLASTEDSLISMEAFYPTESDLNISSQDIDKVVAIPEVNELSPVAEFPGEAKIRDLSGFLTVKIIKPNYFRLSGAKPDFGSSFTENEKAIVVSNTALKILNLKEDVTSLGENVSVKIYYPNSNGIDTKIVEVPSSLTVKGIVTDEFQSPYILLSADLVGENPPFYQRIYAKAKDINSVEILRDKLIGNGFLISARIDLVNQAKKIMTIITIVLGVFGVTALIVSSIGMFNTMVIGFLERIFEVGIMKSIGATSRDISNLFLMESLIMGVLGGVGGILTGVLAGEAVNLGINSLATHLGGNTIQLFIYPWKFMALIIGISGMVGLASGFWPARRAAGLSAKQAFLRK